MLELDGGNEFDWRELRTDLLDRCDSMLDTLASFRARFGNMRDRYSGPNELSIIPYSVFSDEDYDEDDDDDDDEEDDEEEEEAEEAEESPPEHSAAPLGRLTNMFAFSGRNRRLAADLARVCLIIQEVSYDRLRTFLGNLMGSLHLNNEENRGEDNEAGGNRARVVGEWSRLR